MAPSSLVASICSLALVGPPLPRPSLPQADAAPSEAESTAPAPGPNAEQSAGTAPAAAQENPALEQARIDELLDSANRAFQSEHYGSAAELFAEVYGLRPKPAYLWAQAQALRAGGRWQQAIDIYKQYMVANPRPSDTSIAAAQRNIEDCRSQIRKAEGAPETDEENEGKSNEQVALEKVRELSAAPATDQEKYDAELYAERKAALARLPPPPTRPLIADPVGLSVGLTSLATVGAGMAILGGMFRSDRAKANAFTEGEFSEHWSKARTLSKTWPIVTGFGAALLLGAIMRYGVKGHERRKVRRSRKLLQKGIDEHKRRQAEAAKRKRQ